MNDTATMQLCYSSASPFVRKVLILSCEIGIRDQIALVTTHPRNDEAALSAINPLGKIPAILLPSGEALYDSSVICDYLDTEFGNNCFIPPSGPARWRTLMIAALADGVADAGIILRGELTRPKEIHSSDAIAIQLGKIRRGIARLESFVAAAPDSFDLGHVATCCALGWLQFRLADQRFLDGHDDVTTWLESISSRPSVRETVHV